MLVEEKKKRPARYDFFWLMLPIFISAVQIILWLYVWNAFGGKEKQKREM